ncbi:MAG TPA: hypothetical protein VHD88_01140 [Pyrinomonadaceae bacterium]|nr:hypothetical protein [Pyrinomonadaceae bacterium]
MLTKTFLIFCVLGAFLLTECSKTETMNNSNSTAGNSNKAATMSSPAKTTASSSGEKIGVPECDDFIAKYEACADKVPEAGRAQYKSSLAEWRKSWKQLAATPATKGTLAGICKQAAVQQAAALKSYGCTN